MSKAKRHPLWYKEFKFLYHSRYYKAWFDTKLQASLAVLDNKCTWQHLQPSPNMFDEGLPYLTNAHDDEARRLAQTWADAKYYESMTLETFVVKTGK